MKKVVLVTWIGEGNYGTCLQSYALYKKIEALGYDVGIIVEFPRKNLLLSYVKLILTILGITRLVGFCKYLRRNRKGRKVYAFQQANYRIVKMQTKAKLHRLVEATDCFVSGSDQIWNTYFCKFSPLYMLSFAEGKKRVAYASSIGTDSINEVYKETARQLLGRFEHIGVREQKAVEILSELTGRQDIQKVLDPTFLLNPDEWKSMSRTAQYEEPLPEQYIFCYLIGANSCYKEQVEDVRRRTGLEHIIVIPAEENPDFTIDNAVTYRHASPVEFVDLLRKAAFVCTDSFHATAMSINYSIPFVEFMRFSDSDVQSQNSRIHDLLSHYGLQGRVYKKGAKEWTAPIDYSAIQARLNEDRILSKDYLAKAIEH